jgi:hypothetical protein
MKKKTRKLLNKDVNDFVKHKLTAGERNDILADSFNGKGIDTVKYNKKLLQTMNKKLLKVKQNDEVIGTVTSASITPKGIRYKVVLNKKKVYCKDCKYIWCNKCIKVIKYIDTPFEREEVCAECDIHNKNNKCKYFVPKENKEETIKKWWKLW